MIVGETYTVVWRGSETHFGGGGGRYECPVLVRLGKENGKKEYVLVICSKTPPTIFIRMRDKDKPFAAVTA